jgi:anti-sigma-K factor RskA
MAMTEDTVDSEREDIEMLLPWYVMGRLDAEDVARVEAALARDPGLQRQLQLIRDEHEQSRQGNEAIAERPARNVERLLGAVAAREAAVARAAGPGLWDRIRDWFATPPAGALRWAAAAAAVLIVAQAGLLATIVARHPGASYIPAGGGTTTNDPGAIALVSFAATATTSAVADMLAAQGVTIVDGPSAGGLFTVRLGPGSMSDAERQAKVQALRSRNDIVADIIALR